MIGPDGDYGTYYANGDQQGPEQDDKLGIVQAPGLRIAEERHDNQNAHGQYSVTRDDVQI